MNCRDYSKQKKNSIMKNYNNKYFNFKNKKLIMEVLGN